MGTFGYTGVGGSNQTIEDRISGSVFTCPEDGTADKISVALVTASPAWSGLVRCCIYKHSDLSKVAETEERTLTLTTTPTFYDFNFNAPKPSLIAATDYVLVAWAEQAPGLCRARYTTADIVNQGHAQAATYAITFPNPLVPTHEERKYSIYCTYTPTPVVTETIIAKEFPMHYIESPVKAEELTSKVEGATVTVIAMDFPLTALKSGKAEELISKWT